MKVFRFKINSSVVIVNVGVILVQVGLLLAGWMTDNQELVEQMLTPAQLMIFSSIQAALNLFLRVTHVTGKKPVEIISKETE